MEKQRTNSQALVSKAYRNACKDFGLTDAEAAAIVGKTRATLTNGRGFNESSKEHEIQVLFIRLYRALYAILGGDKAAMKHWFTTANKHLRGVPKDLVKRISGLVNVNEYLDAMRAKI
ncbi:MbcA/ParS/Xre antitoxin family protein [Alteromonas sp. ASW11-19]|uniref:MbcA/ParS/Xre antitoxin family protein n=1 Tax=Alteromonas salexigens TaxID=2982530 RepID=A0ABT2VLF5_9ALTE|nr:MbcA/ParS/Xre antitoxin family protein [Alteromonas salexigens]MCU7554142.1 MbcA/ParS/Xre antitoxin family protein [Alteromonas salexigens]